jgi:hypothetical protein
MKPRPVAPVRPRGIENQQFDDCFQMKTRSARNELCRCGSGKKYKRCCGAVIPIRAAAPAPTRIPAASPAGDAAAGTADVAATAPDAPRTCGSCTACCDGWLSGRIHGHDLGPGVPCHFRGVGGCTIYEDRPDDPCRRFVCGWLLKGNPFPDSFRPDKLGVIIVAKRWRDRIAWVLAPAGRDPDANLLEWMREYSTATGAPYLFYVDGRQRGYGSPEFQKEILDKATRGEPLLPGLNPTAGGPCKLMALDL